jgi:hypothetical protein
VVKSVDIKTDQTVYLNLKFFPTKVGRVG